MSEKVKRAPSSSSIATSATTSTAESKSGTGSRKRPAEEDSNPKAAKSQKAVTVPAMFRPRNAPQAFKWLPSLAPSSIRAQPVPASDKPGPSVEKGETKTCLHGVHLDPRPSTKVAFFDLDDTLVTRKSGKKFSDDPADWKLWTPSVPERLKRALADGFAIVIVTNQAGLPKGNREDKWKTKIPMIAEGALSDIPFRIFAAKEKDVFRKPMLGMWDALVEEFRKEGVAVDKTTSFMVGDAAGRIKPKDHSAADRKLAENAGIKFYTPEEYFQDKKIQLPPLTGFHTSSLKEPSDSPIIALTSPTLELVLFVGAPGCGKSSLYQTQFLPAGYGHVNQDTLKDKKRCLKEAERLLGEGTKCVIDNTNRDKATRAEYIQLAKRFKVPIRCVWFDVPLELAWHNNMYRAFYSQPSVLVNTDAVVETDIVKTVKTDIFEEDASSEEETSKGKGKKAKGRQKKTMTMTTTTKTKTTTATVTTTTTPTGTFTPRKLVPWIAYTTFRSSFEEPKEAEGFNELVKVDGFTFRGSEEDRARWNTWMEL
ncbi:PNK3P-domain-containing protein [Ceratobasidium sp. AG-I]|nr:PNK3P-domain-containing protein [Ceratobasidium sp. AG-I]